MADVTINGVVYEELPDGKLRVKGYSMPQSGLPAGAVMLAPPSPEAQYKAPQAETSLAIDRAKLARDAATAPYDARKAAADASKAETDAQIAAAKLRSGAGDDPTGNTAKVRADALAGYKSGQALGPIIAELEQRYREGPGATKGIYGLQDYSPWNLESQRFDKAANAARGIVGSALGFTGGQLNTATEAGMNIGPYIPQASDRDQTILDTIERLKGLRQNAIDRSIAQLGGVPDANGRITPLGANPPAQTPNGPGGGIGGGSGPGNTTPTGGSGGDMALATGDTRDVLNPEREKGVNRLQSLLRSGASDERIRAIASTLNASADSVQAALDFRRKNPSYKGSYNLGDLKFDKQPNSILGQIAASPVGSAITAAGDAVVPLGLLTGEQGRQNLQALRETNPKASFLGTMAGGIPAAAGLELGLARAGLGQLAASRAGDAIYGGVQGANSTGDVTGAGVGALSGLLGGMAGRAAFRGLGGMAGGVNNDSARYLASRDIPTTVGQTLGGVPKQIEDQLTGYPFIGSTINNRRREGLEAFNQTAFSDAVAPLAGQTTPITARPTNTGALGIEQLRAIRGHGYDGAVNGRVAVEDPAYLTAFNDARNRASAIPNTGPDIVSEIDAAVPGYFTNGVITGRNAQAAIKEVKGIRSARQGDALGHRTGNVLRDVENSLTGLFDRQAPGFSTDLAAANRVQGNLKTLEAAVKAAKNQPDELFMPSQLNAASVASANRFGDNAATTQRPFYELGQAGQDVLPSRTADSGTAARLALLGAATAATGGGGAAGYGATDSLYGAGGGSLGGLAALGGVAMLGGSRPAQQALVAALIRRPDVARRIGAQINQNAAIGGYLGAPGGIALLNYAGM